MNKYDKTVLEIDLLKETLCELKHREFHSAVDYITQDIWYNRNKMYSVNIPICDSCINHLYSPEWVLLYCLRCTANNWLYKPLGRLDYYDKHICWMSCCPECAEDKERANIFFTD